MLAPLTTPEAVTEAATPATPSLSFPAAGATTTLSTEVVDLAMDGEVSVSAGAGRKLRDGAALVVLSVLAEEVLYMAEASSSLPTRVKHAAGSGFISTHSIPVAV